jgi:hypothetical protein
MMTRERQKWRIKAINGGKTNRMGLYSIKSMIPANPPDGESGRWWKYEIECGVAENKSICGIRIGSRRDVEAYLKKMIGSINDRTLGNQSVEMRTAHRSPKSIPANLPKSSFFVKLIG